MIAEDEEPIRRGLVYTIPWKKMDCCVVGEARNGMEGAQLIREKHPDIVLVDINMPVMDGYEATQEIRKYSAKVPIIAVTAFAYASDEQRVMENGFDGYMPKPINARQLKAQITEIMQKRIILL